MAQKVLILGDSGTGKSASLRNFNPDEVFVINAAGKPLPFKNHFECFTPSFDKLTQDILQAMDKTNKKVIVVDDAQYIMSFQYMRRIKENGWDKWNDIQGDFFNIIKACDYMPDDVIVYFLSHLQRDDEGREKIKTMGKMLDEKITIEGLFTTVLKTSVQDGQYCFLTQNSGKDTVKSPIGMFPTYAIDNDLKYVDTKIRNYYEMGDFADDEEVAQMDQEAAKASITKEAASDRRSRRRKTADSEEATEAQGSGTADGQGTVSESASGTEGSARRRRMRTAETPEDKMNRMQKEAENAVADAVEPKTDDFGSKDAEKGENQSDRTTDDRKRRVRKERHGEAEEEKPAEAPAEEAKEEAAGEGRKRRERKKPVKHDGFVDVPDGIYEDLPFI